MPCPRLAAVLLTARLGSGRCPCGAGEDVPPLLLSPLLRPALSCSEDLAVLWVEISRFQEHGKQDLEAHFPNSAGFQEPREWLSWERA